MDKPTTKLKVFLVLLTLIVLAGSFSILMLFDQSLRLDESLSLYQVSRSPESILATVAGDMNVPLYHLILHYWQNIWGNGIFASRLLSLLFFLSSIPAMYVLGKLIHGRKAGLYAATIFTVSPAILWYSSEIKMYSLMVLITILNQYFFIRLYRSHLNKNIPTTGNYKTQKNKNIFSVWLFYLITALLGIFTHYFFVLIVLTQWLFALIKRKTFNPGFMYSIASTGLLLVIAYSPWVYTSFIKEGAYGAFFGTQNPTSETIFRTLTNFVFGFQSENISAFVIALWPLAALFIFVLLLNKNSNITHDTALLLYLLIVPLTIMIVVSILWIPLYADKYLILIAPSVYLLITWMFSVYPGFFAKLTQVLLIVAMGVASTNQAISSETPVKENYREASIHLEEYAKPQDIIAISSPITLYPVEYYYSGSAKLDTIPSWDGLDFEDIEEFSQDSLEQKVQDIESAGYSNIWILTSHNQEYEEELLAYFNNNYEKTYEHEFSPVVSLQKYRLRYDEPDHIALIEYLSSTDSEELTIKTESSGENTRAHTENPVKDFLNENVMNKIDLTNIRLIIVPTVNIEVAREILQDSHLSK